MHEHKSTQTAELGSIGEFGAIVDLLLSSFESSDSHVSVPHSGGSGETLVNVPFDEDGSSGSSSGGEDDVGNFHDTKVSLVTELEHSSGGVDVLEVGSRRDEDGPVLSDHSGSHGNENGIRDDVSSVRNVDDLAAGVLGEGVSKGNRVVRVSVSLGSQVLDVDDVR